MGRCVGAVKPYGLDKEDQDKTTQCIKNGIIKKVLHNMKTMP